MSLDVKKVAIIGAGISGVCCGRHLLARGLQVTLFERSSGFGGVWFVYLLDRVTESLI